MAPPSKQQYSPSDFLYGPTLGEGRFGTVLYAELKTPSTEKDATADSRSHDDDVSLHRQSGPRQHQAHAIKMIPKSEILRHNQIQAVMTEKHILTEILSENPLSGSELFMKLFLCFHDSNCLYLVLELCAGGTLFDLIQSRSITRTEASTPVMGVSWVRQYAAQILRAIEYLHQRGVVHRDISPQNIGLTYPKGDIKLGDFGAAVVFVKEECEGTMKLKRCVPSGAPPAGQENSSDFVGTADYVSPEMIRGNQCKGHTQYPAIDLWSLGCLIYQMFTGESPFHAANDHLAFESVIHFANGRSDLCFPAYFDRDAKELVKLLLTIDPGRRLGMQDGVIESSHCSNSTERHSAQISSLKRYQSIRDHSFFQMDKDASLWNLLENKSIEPPHKPAQPEWMAELSRGDVTLTPLENIQFDL